MTFEELGFIKTDNQGTICWRNTDENGNVVTFDEEGLEEPETAIYFYSDGRFQIWSENENEIPSYLMPAIMKQAKELGWI